MRFEEAPRRVGSIFDEVALRVVDIKGFIGVVASFKQLTLRIIVVVHTAIKVTVLEEETSLGEETFRVKIFLKVFEVSDFVYRIQIGIDSRFGKRFPLSSY